MYDVLRYMNVDMSDYMGQIWTRRDAMKMTKNHENAMVHQETQKERGLKPITLRVYILHIITPSSDELLLLLEL